MHYIILPSRYYSTVKNLTVTMRASYVEERYQRYTLVLLVFTCMALLWPIAGRAQNVQYTKNAADLNLRSDLTVNPATRAVELQLPLGGYPGRAGSSLPVTISYSSKVWRIDYQGYRPNYVGGHDIGGYTITAAKYSEHASGGWTTNLDFPVFDTPTNEIYDQSGYPITNNNCNGGCYAVDRMRIVMADGSIHEFRSTDQPYVVTQPSTLPDDLYSVDGTHMRYQRSTSTLFMPDGSRYLFGSNQYVDRNGNAMTLAGVTTDTLGRSIPRPPLGNAPLGPAAGDYTYSLPGVGTSTIDYTFHWKHLSDLGVLTTNQPLQYISDMGCGGDMHPEMNTSR